MKQALIWASGGTGFTFLMTTLGAAMVFLFRGKINMKIQRVFLGFAAGVMIAASVWSLLIPAIDEAEAAGGVGWIPAAGGFVLGILFLLLMDQLLPHLHAGSDEPEGISSSWKRTTLLVMAVTLPNIPEGMAVGLAFAMAAQNMGAEARCGGSVRSCPGNRYPELPGRSGDIPAFKAGRDAFLESVCLRQPFRNCGTDFRYSGCSDCRRNPAAYALASQLCGRRHDVCGSGGAHS